MENNYSNTDEKSDIKSSTLSGQSMSIERISELMEEVGKMYIPEFWMTQEEFEKETLKEFKEMLENQSKQKASQTTASK